MKASPVALSRNERKRQWRTERAAAVQQIITLAISHGYKQAQMAAALGVDKSLISRWRAGRTVPIGDHWQHLQTMKEALQTVGELPLAQAVDDGTLELRERRAWVRRRNPRVRETQQIINLARHYGYKVKPLAEALGVSSSVVRRWRGGDMVPNDEHWQRLQAVCEALSATGKLS